MFDLEIQAKGDCNRRPSYVEDVGITLGQAFAQAWATRRRAPLRSCLCALDEALSRWW